MDDEVLTTVILSLAVAVYFQFRAYTRTIAAVAFLKFALFLWVVASVVGVTFGGTVPFFGGRHWYSFLSSFVYGTPLSLTFLAAFGFLREAVEHIRGTEKIVRDD